MSKLLKEGNLEMIRAVSRTMSLLVLTILTLSGCAAFPLRNDATHPQPVPEQSPDGAAFHYSLSILSALNENLEEAIREMEKARRRDPSSPYLAKEIASLYMEKGEPGKALAICKKNLEEHPDDIDTLLLLGELYLHLKDFKNAAEQYRRVIDLDTNNIAARFYLGTCHAELKQIDKAVAVFQELLQIDPNHFMTNYYLARILADQQRFDEAEAAFKKTLALRPDFETAMIDLARLYEQQKKITPAIEIYNAMKELLPPRPMARIRLGELFLREKRYDEAESEFREVLKLDPANRDVRLTLGLIFLERGQHGKAIEAIAALVKEYPMEYRLVYLLGTTYEESRADEKAVEILKRIPVTADEFTNAQIRIAMILKRQKRAIEAVDSLVAAIRKKNDAPGLYAYLASLYGEEKRFPAAEAILREGLGIIPDSVDLHYGLGVLFEKTDRFEETISAMQAVLKIDPNHAEALNFIGYLYADRGIHLDEAERMIKRALALKPGNGYMIDSLGWVYFRQNRLDAAIRYLKEASEALPEDAAIIEHLGDVYLRMGKIREAVEAYGRAIRFNPESETLKKKLDGLIGKTPP
jgi:tetratricopeptide (TPR) repeat protein